MSNAIRNELLSWSWFSTTRSPTRIGDAPAPKSFGNGPNGRNETTSGASERVLIVAPNGDFEYFYYGGEGPLDLNDAQFDTLKLAADGGRTVTVSYQWEPDPRPYYAGTKPVNSVAVWF